MEVIAGNGSVTEVIGTEVGLVSVTFRNLNYLEIIDYCVKTGLQCIEWGSDVHVPQNDPEHAKAVRKATEEAGLRISSYGSYYKLGIAENIEEAFLPYLETAKILGAPLIRIWSGSIDFEKATEENYRKAVEETRILCDMAAPFGITLAFEFHPGSLSNTGEHALQLLHDINKENFKSYFQYDARISIEENLKSLELVLPYLVMVHVAYYDNNWQRHYLDELDGTLLWTEIVKRVKQSDSRASFLFEFLKDSTLDGLQHQKEAFQMILKSAEES